MFLRQRFIWIRVSIAYQHKRKSINQKIKNSKAFINHSQTINDVYENLEDYNPTKKGKVLIVFDDMTTDMEVNKRLSHIVTGLFLKGRGNSTFHLFSYHNLT